MRIKLIMLVIAGMFLVGCKKDKFPDEFSIYGKWKEYTNETEKTEVEFKRDNVMLLKLVHDTIRKYNYLLDKPNELQVFDPAEFPDGRSTIHKVTYNRKDEQMTIFGLYPTIDNITSATIFVRK